MNEIFQRDAFLYLAFLSVGLMAVVEDFTQKMICLGASFGLLVVRSFVKKYLEK